MDLYNDEIEAKILSILLKEPLRVDEALKKIQSHFFYRKEHSNVYQTIKKVYEKFHIALDRETLESYLDKSLRKLFGEGKIQENQIQERKELYLKLYDRLVYDNPDSTNYSFLLDELKDLHIKRSVYGVSKKILEDLKGGKEGLDITKKIENQLSKIRVDAQDIQVIKRFMHERVDERWNSYTDRRDHPEKYVGMLFGLQGLDEITNGMQKTELGMVFARTGRGKSRFLFNFAYNASKAKHHVVYFSLEMYIQQIERMYDSRDARISYTRCKMGRLTQQEEESYKFVLSQQKKRQDYFYTIDIPRGCTMPMVESEVNNYEQKFGHGVDLIIIDYLLLMRQTGSYNSTSERLGSLAREMKELARLKQNVIFTANQANRGAVDTDTVSIGTEHISMSDHIAPQCDLVLYLEQSPEDKLKNLLQNHVVKYRDGGNRKLTHYVAWDQNFIGDKMLTVSGKTATGTTVGRT